LWFPELPIRLDILYKYFVTGEDDKAVFFIPSEWYRSCGWTPIKATWAGYIHIMLGYIMSGTKMLVYRMYEYIKSKYTTGYITSRIHKSGYITSGFKMSQRA
jgi:hypothetical protein